MLTEYLGDLQRLRGGGGSGSGGGVGDEIRTARRAARRKVHSPDQPFTVSKAVQITTIGSQLTVNFFSKFRRVLYIQRAFGSLANLDLARVAALPAYLAIFRNDSTWTSEVYPTGVYLW